MISWISKTFSSVKITPENNAISIDNQQIKLLNPYQKREHRTGHPRNYPPLYYREMSKMKHLLSYHYSNHKRLPHIKTVVAINNKVTV